MLIRGVYYDGWHMVGTPTKERHKQEFLDHVNPEIGRRIEVDLEQAVRAEFEVMCDKIDLGEMNKLINVFPEELRDLWPAARRVAIGKEGGAPGWQW